MHKSVEAIILSFIGKLQNEEIIILQKVTPPLNLGSKLKH